jgi:hypothetical protein
VSFFHESTTLSASSQFFSPVSFNLSQLASEEEFTKHLQKAVDLYRPKFDEEASLGDIFNNTQLLWHTLWKKSIDVRAAIIRPALERSRHDYEAGDPSLKARLAKLRPPGKSSN